MPPSELTYEKRHWLDRFRHHLVQLTPSMNCLTAVKHALAVFPAAAHLEPEEAANVFAAEQLTAGKRAAAVSVQALQSFV